MHSFSEFLSAFYIMVVHFAAALFTGYMLYVARPGSTFFSWHPTLMTLAFALLMFEAIVVFSPQSSLIAQKTRPFKVLVHWIMQVLASVLGGVGLAVIMVNKEHNGKPHFKTWHGLFGLATLVLVVVQCLLGAVVKYPKIAGGVRPFELKLYHATSGLFLYTVACATLVLGMFSNWFVARVRGTSWYACIVSVAILILAVMNQIVTAYQPRKKTRSPRK